MLNVQYIQLAKVDVFWTSFVIWTVAFKKCLERQEHISDSVKSASEVHTFPPIVFILAEKEQNILSTFLQNLTLL